MAVEEEKCGGGGGGGRRRREMRWRRIKRRQLVGVKSREQVQELKQRVWLELYQIGHLGFGSLSHWDLIM